MNSDNQIRDAYIEAYQSTECTGWLLWLFEDNKVVLKIIVQSRSLGELLQQNWIAGKIWL